MTTATRASAIADSLRGSEILKIAADVRTLIAAGHDVCNLTVGDFSPTEFRIPGQLERGIVEALHAGETNYPPSDGILQLREAVRAFYGRELGFTPDLASVVITAGSRPGIFATYASLVDPGDVVVYPAPSWNNNHYVQLAAARGICVPCDAESNFLPTAAILGPHLESARLLVLCSPLNPSGTMFTEDALRGICELVVQENARRGAGVRPLYLMYDQVYWTLTFGANRHVHPIGVCPDVAPFTIYIDGISKAFAATGVRVGWIVAPPDIAAPMSGFLGHVGAWAPKAEQGAVAKVLSDAAGMSEYHSRMRSGLKSRLDLLFNGIQDIGRNRPDVSAIAPQGAIYLSARFAIAGTRTSKGLLLETDEQVRQYLLQEAGVAIVPFQAFGVQSDSGWYRLSVGAVSEDQIRRMLPRLESAIDACA